MRVQPLLLTRNAGKRVLSTLQWIMRPESKELIASSTQGNDIENPSFRKTMICMTGSDFREAKVKHSPTKQLWPSSPRWWATMACCHGKSSRAEITKWSPQPILWRRYETKFNLSLNPIQWPSMNTVRTWWIRKNQICVLRGRLWWHQRPQSHTTYNLISFMNEMVHLILHKN